MSRNGYYDEENLLITNQRTQLKKVLEYWIERSDEVLICSPFVTGNPLVYRLLEDRSKRIEIFLKLDFPTTPQFLESILKYTSQSEKCVYAYSKNSQPSLHAKIYFFRKNEKHLAAIVGSSNLTTSGITTNLEINVLTKTHLKELFEYIQEIKGKKHQALSEKVIAEYKVDYKRPDPPRGYKATKNYNLIYDKYERTLERYHRIEALLQDIYHDKDLPFTYLFDAFCHHFKSKMIKKENLSAFPSFKPDEVKKLYELFVSKYFSDREWRIELYKRSRLIIENMEQADDALIRAFFQDIHSVHFGSGSGKRMQHIKREKVQKLRNLLTLMRDENMNISQRVALAVIPPSKYRVRYLGESAVMEIPGRLFPDEYPIVNGKFHSVLDFLSA